jgi:molybdopterin converting factor small subunit
MEMSEIHIRVVAHGLLTVAVPDPRGAIALTVPQGMDVQGVLELLQEISPVFDPRATPIAVIRGAQVPLSTPVQDGDEVHLYPIFGGG